MAVSADMLFFNLEKILFMSKETEDTKVSMAPFDIWAPYFCENKVQPAGSPTS